MNEKVFHVVSVPTNHISRFIAHMSIYCGFYGQYKSNSEAVCFVWKLVFAYYLECASFYQISYLGIFGFLHLGAMCPWILTVQNFSYMHGWCPVTSNHDVSETIVYTV